MNKRADYTVETAFYAARDYNDAIICGMISGQFDQNGDPADAAWHAAPAELTAAEELDRQAAEVRAEAANERALFGIAQHVVIGPRRCYTGCGRDAAPGDTACASCTARDEHEAAGGL